MAFKVTVIDREDLEVMAGRTCDASLGCDNCDTGATGLAEGQLDDTVTAQLSPLED
jgi:hypothetical protein